MKSYKEKQEEEDYEEDKRRRNCDEISSSSVLIAAHSDQHHPLHAEKKHDACSIHLPYLTLPFLLSYGLCHS